MEIYKGYIIMAIGAAVVLIALIGFITTTVMFHRRKEKMLKRIYEER